MLQVKGLDAFNATVNQWLGNVEKAAAEAAVGLAKQVFNQILYTSPQYSGDFVANWKVGYGSVDSSFQGRVFNAELYNADEPFKRGDTKAIRHAQANANWRPLTKLGQSIFLSNSAAHDEPYAVKIEQGMIKLRSVNAGAAHVVRRAVTAYSNRYAKINAAQLAVLRKS
jgi:hypothetical protein